MDLVRVVVEVVPDVELTGLILGLHLMVSYDPSQLLGGAREAVFIL